MRSMGIDRAEHLMAALRGAAALDPAAEALVGDDRRLTYEALQIELRKVWACLEDHQLGAGDIIALRTKNGLDAALWTFGVMTYGSLILPISPHLSEAEALVLIDHAPARLLISAEPWTGGGPRTLDIDAYRGYPPSSREPRSIRDAHCILIYTSGTSGDPKGILLTQANILDNVHHIVSALGMKPGHRTACILPQYHLFGIISDIATMLLGGGCAVITPEFDYTRLPYLQRVLVDESIQSFSGVPLIYEGMTTLPFDLTGHSLKFCVSGAAPLRPKVAKAFEAKHRVPLIPGYGLSETTCYAALNPSDRVKFGSIGKPMPFNEIIVVDEQDRLVSTGEQGEILIRGANVMNQTYHRRNDDIFSSHQKGFLRTGDIGYMDEDGYFFICGRRSSMVIRGGDKIYLEDVDRFMTHLPEVAEVASGRLHREHQEKIVTFVVPATDIRTDGNALRAAARQLLGVRRCPDRVFVVEALPRTPTHKVRIGELEKMASEWMEERRVAGGALP